MTSSGSEWGDFPSSNELFGNEFFNDDFVDIYTNSNDDDTDRQISSLLEDNVSPDEEVSNGLLVAMNAAAMDGELFGSSSEFIPACVPSVSLMGSQPVAPTVAPTASVVNQAPAAVPSSESVAVKRTVTSEVSHQVPVAKKPKAAPISYAVRAPAAPVPLPVGSSAPPAIYPGSVPLPATVPVSRAVVPAKVVPASVLSMKMPVGGVAHIVVPRPPAVPYSAAARKPPTTGPTLTATARAAVNKAENAPQQPVNNAQNMKPMEVSSSGVKRATTEADFKGVASAAVSSLIQSVSGMAPTNSIGGKMVGAKPTEKPIDTSTAHVHALTSQSWITACSNPIPTPVVSTSEIDKAARNAHRAALTQEERAKQNRDRNREHARNTRLRKKAYVEELKRTLTEIVTQRDSADAERMHAAQREREQREVRFRVMEEFLKLRGRNELNASRWVAILEDGFTLTLPRTDFRQMVSGDKASPAGNDGGATASRMDLEQVIHGAGLVMEDSQYLSNFLQTIGSSEQVAHPPQVQIIYRCDRKRFHMDSSVTFMDFVAETVGAVNRGLPSEVVFKCSMRSLFSPTSNKLISSDITFDTGVILNQLERMGYNFEDHDPEEEDDDAEAAANEADALLDSIQMPQFVVDNSTDGNANGPPSVSSDDSSNQS